MKRIVTVIFIMALLGGVGLFIFRWQQQRNTNQNSNLQTTLATRGELIATIGATG